MQDNKVLDVLLVLALAGSGKSEARKSMRSLGPEKCKDQFHIWPTVQIDDYPYVEFMRFVDELVSGGLEALDMGGLFFRSHRESFKDQREWGTLVQLVNMDYDDILHNRNVEPESPGLWLLKRIALAQEFADIYNSPLRRLPEDVLKLIASHLEDKTQKVLDMKREALTGTLEGKTLVIEFARGGPHGASMPLRGSQGYQFSLPHLSPAILSCASILYIKVPPSESRRKNFERAVPPPDAKDKDDTGIWHGVPLSVMLSEYGSCDMEYLRSLSDRSDTVRVRAHGKEYYLPIGIFDNTTDLTSFARGDPDDWDPKDIQALHAGLKPAMDTLWVAQANR
ncbi:MAG: hypothetical protein ABIH21_00400 [Patescibacteria group bacterium]